MIEIKDDDLVCVKFKEDFVLTFDNKAYMIEFDFTRASWVRLHYAIDLAFEIFGIDYLIPKEIIRRKMPLADVNLNGAQQLALNDGRIVNWFNASLNLHQKQAVVNVLRGELLNPYLIYGPPGNEILFKL